MRDYFVKAFFVLFIVVLVSWALFTASFIDHQDAAVCVNHTETIVFNHTEVQVVTETVVQLVERAKPVRGHAAVGVGILLPTTSRVGSTYCGHCLNVFTVAIRELMSVLPKNDTRFWYTVYVGYDAGDPMWDHTGRLAANLDTANQLMRDHPAEVKGVRVVPYPNPAKGSLTNVWNKLSEAALADGNEFVFLDNDDLIIETHNFAARLVDALMANPVLPGLGEAAPYDTSFPDENHPTFPMVSRLHFEIFGAMYSTDIFSRGCDTWLGDVYRGFRSVISLSDVRVSNTAYDTPRRYDNEFAHERYVQLVAEGRTKIAAFLAARGVPGEWPTTLCGVANTFGC